MSQEHGSENPSSAPANPTQALAELIDSIERDPTPIEDYRLESRFGALRRELVSRDMTIPDELEWEEIAFLLEAASETNDAWGVYYGQAWQSGALEKINLNALEYWRARAAKTTHPILRARYADLTWELPKSGKIVGAKPDAEMGRLAVDSYLEGLSEDRFGHASVGVEKARRALDLALNLRDKRRVEHVPDAILALDQRIAADDSPGLWIGFDLFIEPANKAVELTSAWQERLVQQMETRLAKFDVGPPSQYHPAYAEAATLRLASHYRRGGKKDDIARVFATFTRIVRSMKGVAAPLVQSHSLAILYGQLKTFDLHSEADLLNDDIRVAGDSSLSELKEISVEVPEIPPEKLERYFTAMLDGSPSDILERIAIHFVPNRGVVENQLRELAQTAPISYLIPHAILDHQGRTIAQVGPLASDLEGNVIKHVDQNLRLGVPWLRETMRRAFDNKLLTGPDVVDFLLASPVFGVDRRIILERGVGSYVAGDSITAIHILVPQIEAAVRSLATLIQAPIYSQRRGGGFHARLLDEFLRDDRIEIVLSESATTYLRALLSDQRGWNIRNDITHGLAPAASMTLAVADRVLHALLVFGLLRQQSEEEPSGESVQSTPPEEAT